MKEKKRVAFFTRDLIEEPGEQDDLAEDQILELRGFCKDFNRKKDCKEKFLSPIAELQDKFMELNPETQNSLPLMEQTKIMELLNWTATNPGEVDAILICSCDHLSPHENEVRAFREELTHRRIELISMKEKLEPLGLTPEHEKINEGILPPYQKNL